MKRNAIIALIISVLAMNLPFWQFENRIQLFAGSLIIWTTTFALLVDTEPERRERQ